MAGSRDVSGFIFQNSDMSEGKAQEVMQRLTRGIREIQNGNASNLRFEELYRFFNKTTFSEKFFCIFLESNSSHTQQKEKQKTINFAISNSDKIFFLFEFFHLETFLDNFF